MALSSRELLLILRARDEASRVLRTLGAEFGNLNGAALQAARSQIAAGSGLVSLGAGISAMGAASLVWLKGSVDEAIEFERAIARVSTQLDKVEGTQKQLADIVKRTARDIAVPIEQLSDTLYDIFSSMDVSVPQSEALLRSFAKEAVAGQVDLQTAARATIGVLNSFHLKAEDVTRVQDVQFQLVRKGVGTYEQFSQVIGRATPSAHRAGQSVEMLAGMLAFLTRNGLSAAMASASAGRAFDAFAHPKTVARLEKMGVTVKDAAGNFRPLTEVMVDLQKKMSSLTDPERAAALQDLFKSSGGTIQARRFFDAVLKDSESVQQFVSLVDSMNNAQGAFGDAYNTMANTTASQSQLLKNQWQLLRIEVGEALIPIFRQLMTWLQALLGWWNGLSDSTKKTIVTVIAIGSALAVLLGIAIVAAGAFMMLAGAAAMLGIGIGALLGIFALIIVGIAAVIVIAILLAKNWDKITAVMSKAWNAFMDVLKAAWAWLDSVIGDKLAALWNRVSEDIIAAVQAVGKWVHDIWYDIVAWTQEVWPMVQQVIGPIVEWLVTIWDNVVNILAALLRILVDTFSAAWIVIAAVVKGAWQIVSGVLEGIIHILQGVIQFILAVFTLNWSQAWEGIKLIFQGIWEIIGGIVTGVWTIIVGVIEGAFKLIGSIVVNGWDIVKNLFVAAVETIRALWNAFWGWISDIVVGAWEAIKTGVSKGFWAVVGWFKDLPNKIFDAFARAGEWLIGVGERIIDGLITGMKNKFGPVKTALEVLRDYIPIWKGPPSVDKVLLHNNGRLIMQGLLAGLQSEERSLRNYLGDLTTSIPGFSVRGSGSPGYGNMEQNITIYTQEIDPRRHGAELGFELFKGPVR